MVNMSLPTGEKLVCFKQLYLIKYESHLCERMQYLGGEEVMVTPVRTPRAELNAPLVKGCMPSHAQALYPL